MAISNKKLIVIFVLLVLTHTFCSILYGLKVPWGGDEWFSYNDFNVMGLPFSISVSVLKIILGPVSKDNYILYRLQGLFWSTLIFFFSATNLQSRIINLAFEGIKAGAFIP